MSKIHIGPHTRMNDPEPDPHPAAGTFDREINLRGIVYTAAGLVAVALVVHLIIWGLIRGFDAFDERRDPPPAPLPEANVQPPPPGPRLQTTPELDMRQMRQEEDLQLGPAGWIDPQQGTVHVPIDVAMEVIAGRGLGPEVVGGTPGAFPGTVAQPQAAQAEPALPPQERR